MNADSPSNGITRRSFIKRSVVAAVAAANLSVLSGLVNASGESVYEIMPGCELHVEMDDDLGAAKCWFERWDAGKNCATIMICGDNRKWDDPNATTPVVVRCAINNSADKAVMCDIPKPRNGDVA